MAILGDQFLQTSCRCRVCSSKGCPKECPMCKKNSENVHSSGKHEIFFRNLRHVLTFWIYSGLNRVRVIGTGGLQRKSLFSNIFTRIFAYFSHFYDIFLCWTNKKFVIQVEINIANAKNYQTMLTEYIALGFYGHTGVLACRIKEKSADRI